MTGSADPLTVSWEGAAGRSPVRFAVIRIRSIERESSGIFGIRRSPSLGDWMPDAHFVKAETMDGAAVRLRLPGGEAARLSTVGLYALGLVDEAHCICIIAAPTGMPAADVPAWAVTQPCG